jgi:ATP-binding cassette subfamily B protein
MNRFAGLSLLGPYLKPYRGRVALALLSLMVAAACSASRTVSA